MSALKDLPIEMQSKVANYLSLKDLMSFSRVSKQCNKVVQMPVSWKQFFKEENIPARCDLQGPKLFLLHWSDLKKKYRVLHPWHRTFEPFFASIEEVSTEQDKAAKLVSKFLSSTKEDNIENGKKMIRGAASFHQLMLRHHCTFWIQLLALILEKDNTVFPWIFNNDDCLKIFSETADAFEIYSLIKHTEKTACVIFKDKRFESAKQNLLGNKIKVEHKLHIPWAYALALKYSEFAELALKEGVFRESLNIAEYRSLIRHSPKIT